MNRRGFTVIEIIIVITIMAVFLVLGVVNFRSSQIKSRDNERKIDIDTIAQHLESYYTSGTNGSTTFGSYPSILLTSSLGNMKLMLRDIDEKTITAPGITNPTNTFISANNNLQTVSTVTIASPPITIDYYIYQPLKNDDSLCSLSTDECVKYNLYYKNESDGVINMVTSKNQ